MFQKVTITPNNIMNFFGRIFFFIIYLVIQAFVYIGETTEVLVLSPFRLIHFLFKVVQKKIFELLQVLLSALRRKSEGGKVTTVTTEGYTPVSFTALPGELLKEINRHRKRIEHETFEKGRSFWLTSLHKAKEALLIFTATFVFKTLTYVKAFLRLFNSVKHSTHKVQDSVGSLHIGKRVFSFLRSVGLGNTFRRLFSFIKKLQQYWMTLFKMSIASSFKYFVLGFATCFLIIALYQSYIFVTLLPSPQNIGKVNFPQSTHLYDRNGRLLYEIFHEQNRTPIRLHDLPNYVAQASIAIEDKDFYKHSGISFVSGILRAIKDTYKTKELQGGSTITQQLVKTALLTPERTITRKLKEMFLALWTERMYTKDQILEMYLNQVPYGGSAYGIEEAAKTYFSKSATQLTLGEAALLAGLTRAPSIYSPYINPELAVRRHNDVLRRMYDLHYITEKEFKTALAEKVKIIPPHTTIHAPHFVFYLKKRLEDEFGIKQVEEGGFKVTTTLDLDIQEESEKILREELEKIRNLNVSNGGILVLKPTTGEILAMVGSVDYFASPSGAYNVTVDATRQPGSTLKPILYSLALEKGFTAASPIDDAPVAFKISATETYKPVNYDGKFHGRIPIRMALANSYNIPAIKTLNQLGIQPFIDQARKFGIDTWNDPSRFGLSIALGGGEVTLLDLAEAYSVFANKGYHVEPNGVQQLVNGEGRTIYDLSPHGQKVLDEGVAYIISDILSDNVARQQAFGAHSFLEVPGYKVAVKTGTTNDKKDNLTVGYTPEFLVAVWVGNNDNTPMNPYLTSGITGAAPIWNRVMLYLLQNKVKDVQSLSFVKPENVVEKPCYYRKVEYFVAGTEKNAPCGGNVFKPAPSPTNP